MLMKMNAIRNCPVTTEDVNIAKNIFRADMMSLKGKSTHQKSTPVREDTVAIPQKSSLQTTARSSYALT
jgi:hypothetical protein